jgi:hypothetical protein
MSNSSTNYKDSPFGEAIHPWLNKPDTKFDDRGTGGEFKVALAIEGSAGGEAMFNDVSAASQRAFDDWMADEKGGLKLPKLKREEFKVYCPAHVERDENTGEPTGRYVFDFRQNAKIKLRDGTFKDITIGLYDSTGKGAVTRGIWSGSIIRVRYAMRAIPMPGLKQVGVRLDFASVQVRKFGGQQNQQQGGGFEADPEGEAVEEGMGPDNGSVGGGADY